MKFFRSKKGYYYKEYKNGKKVRISKDKYLKNKKQIGGNGKTLNTLLLGALGYGEHKHKKIASLIGREFKRRSLNNSNRYKFLDKLIEYYMIQPTDFDINVSKNSNILKVGRNNKMNLNATYREIIFYHSKDEFIQKLIDIINWINKNLSSKTLLPDNFHSKTNLSILTHDNEYGHRNFLPNKIIFKDQENNYYFTYLERIETGGFSGAVIYRTNNENILLKYNQDYDDQTFNALQTLSKQSELMNYNPLKVYGSPQLTHEGREPCGILIIMEKYSCDFQTFITDNLSKMNKTPKIKIIKHILNETMKQIDVILKLNESNNLSKYKYLPLDLKPANILIKTGNGNNILDVKLCDLDGFIVFKRPSNNKNTIGNVLIQRPPELNSASDGRGRNRSIILNLINSSITSNKLFSWYIGFIGYMALNDKIFDNLPEYLTGSQLQGELVTTNNTNNTSNLINEIKKCLNENPEERRNFYKENGEVNFF